MGSVLRGAYMKIGLFLGTEPYSGGMFQYNQAMLAALDALQDENHSVVVAYTSKLWEEHLQGGIKLKSIFIKNGFWGRAARYTWSWLQLPVSIWRRICPFFHPVAKALLAARCDLWIIPTQNDYSFQMPVPVLATIHDLMHRYESRFPEVSAAGMYRMREWGSRNTCSWARGVLVDSDIGKQHVMESYGLREDRIHVLPYIAPRYIYADQVPEGFDRRYPLPQKFIFYPAQFWEHKNHKRLITSVGLLKPSIPDLKLVLTGSIKSGFQSVIELIQKLKLTDDVVILGYVPDEDMPELYRRARALIMPTFFGPTNIPPLEAFVAGCPVAISGIYGMPDQVGDAALLFNPSSLEEISQCIRSLWTDDNLCARLKERGRQKAASWGQPQFNDRLRSIVDHIVKVN